MSHFCNLKILELNLLIEHDKILLKIFQFYGKKTLEKLIIKSDTAFKENMLMEFKSFIENANSLCKLIIIPDLVVKKTWIVGLDVFTIFEVLSNKKRFFYNFINFERIGKYKSYLELNTLSPDSLSNVLSYKYTKYIDSFFSNAYIKHKKSLALSVDLMTISNEIIQNSEKSLSINIIILYELYKRQLLNHSISYIPISNNYYSTKILKNVIKSHFIKDLFVEISSNSEIS